MIKQFLSATVGTLSLLGSSQASVSEPAKETRMLHTDLQNKIDTVDVWMHKAIENLHIPGVAIALVFDGQIVLAKGYGLRDASNASLPVTEQTLFAIGSCSKALRHLP